MHQCLFLGSPHLISLYFEVDFSHALDVRRTWPHLTSLHTSSQWVHFFFTLVTLWGKEIHIHTHTNTYLTVSNYRPQSCPKKPLLSHFTPLPVSLRLSFNYFQLHFSVRELSQTETKTCIIISKAISGEFGQHSGEAQTSRCSTRVLNWGELELTFVSSDHLPTSWLGLWLDEQKAG